MPGLLARDYRPRSPLVLPTHRIGRPRFPAVDAHNHLHLPNADAADSLARVMDEAGIRSIVNLSGGFGDDLRRLVDLTASRHPGRFATFANVDWSRIDEPNFGESAAHQLAESVRAGASGLKIFKELGLVVRDRAGRLVRPDDTRLDPIWQAAGDLGVPVLIHVADPVAFFDPLDATNDSWLELEQHPDWHFHGGDYPTFRDLIEAGISLMARHPRTTFITAHVGWYTESLRFVGEQILDRLPNVYTDFSARLRWLAPQPYSAREFVTRYQDRILFGTDQRPTVATYRHYYRYLETADEGFEGRPGDFLSRGCGIFLPDEVLEKVYYLNAVRAIPGLA